MFSDAIPGGWCNSCGPVECLKQFVSVPKVTLRGDLLWLPVDISKWQNVIEFQCKKDLFVCRWTYFEFYSRYNVLMTNEEAGLDDKTQTCKYVLQRLIQVAPLYLSVLTRWQMCLLTNESQLWFTPAPLVVLSPWLCFQDPNQYKFGRTKIFLRAGQVAYLEKLRLDRLRAACITIQKYVRGWNQRRKYQRLRQAAILVQQYIRGKRTVRLVAFSNGSKSWVSEVKYPHNLCCFVCEPTVKRWAQPTWSGAGQQWSFKGTGEASAYRRAIKRYAWPSSPSKLSHEVGWPVNPIPRSVTVAYLAVFVKPRNQT